MLFFFLNWQLLKKKKRFVKWFDYDMKPDWLYSLQLPPNERRVHVPGGLGGATLQRNLCPRFLRRRLPGALLVRQRWRVPRRHRTLSVHARIHGQQPAVASSQPHSCDVANDPSTLHFWGQFCLVVYRANFLTCLGSIKVGNPCSSSYWLWPPHPPGSSLRESMQKRHLRQKLLPRMFLQELCGLLTHRRRLLLQRR